MQQPHLFPHELGHHLNPHGYTHGKLFHLRATAPVHEQPHQTTRISSQVALPPLRAVFVKLLTLSGNPPTHGKPFLICCLSTVTSSSTSKSLGSFVHIRADRYNFGQAFRQQVQVWVAGASLGRHLGSLGRQCQIRAGPRSKKTILGSRSGISYSRKKLGQEALIWIFLQKLSFVDFLISGSDQLGFDNY